MGNLKIKITILLFFLLFILLKAYLMIFQQRSLDFKGVLFLILLIIIFVYNRPITWLIGIAIFAYALYYFFFIAPTASATSMIEFTNPLIILLFGDHTGQKLRHMLKLFPYFFFGICLILFTTKPIRQLYFKRTI